MLNLKKTALAVIALGSTAAFAGTMGPVCSAVNVTVPCETCAWDIGGRALYLQPTGFNDLSGYITFQTNTTTSGAQNSTLGFNPNWGWGWQLEASYHYSSGNDINVNWYHFRNGTTYNPITSTNPQIIISPGDQTGTNFFNNALSVNPAWDQVNIEVGQHVDFGENKFARLHGGFNLSRVGKSGYVAQTFNIVGETTVGSQTDNVASSLNAFGPRVGMDLNYEWGNGLGVYADGALSVLAGSSKASLNHIDYDTAANTYTVSTSRNNVVGELDAKVGFMYTYACAQGDLSLDVGWVWASYSSGIDSVVGVAQDTQVQTQNTDWGIQGLYFGAKWIGNVA